MLNKKQAKKVRKHFDKMVCRIEYATPRNKSILFNVGKAESFIKALKLAEVIDAFTAEEMASEVLEAEQNAYKNARKASDMDGEE